MTLYLALGEADQEISSSQAREGITRVLQQLGPRRRVLLVPPDFTRRHSQAGPLTCLLHELLGEAVVDVMPALGTHEAMSPEQLRRMFPTLPASLVRVHDWRHSVDTIGQVPADFVAQATENVWTRSWPAQLNRLAWRGEHDLIVSIGQVVPHEVIGMANYNKNLFVGIGGAAGINESHFIGAAYGMERMMGRADTPLRRILNYAQETFCGHLPLLFVLTVVESCDDGQLRLRGLFVGDDHQCFELASNLAARVNVFTLNRRPDKVVAYLEPDEFHSTWLGNKAVYRTRMAIADEGELVVLAPGVKSFGEDAKIDELIRKYGYRTTPEIMQHVAEQGDLQANLSAAAHLIHGSSEGRFRITYCPGGLTSEEITGVGYEYQDLQAMLRRYPPEKLRAGWNSLPDGEEIYYIPNPALGLWAADGLG